MQEIQYKTFSLKTHKRNWRIKSPNVCQLELTFKCGLHCKHCYTDCYNPCHSEPEAQPKAKNLEEINSLKDSSPLRAQNDSGKQTHNDKGYTVPNYGKELTTAQVKSILDKVFRAGVLWLCFTGGDPLTRKDFLELYSYAKNKGFIITIFTNGYSMDRELAEYFRKSPPFALEITLNAATKKTYEKISQVKDSYEKAVNGIKMLLKNKLPLKIKTQVTLDNLEELPQIKNYIENLGLSFRPNVFLHARLDGNSASCSLRIPPHEVLSLDGDKRILDNCQPSEKSENALAYPKNKRVSSIKYQVSSMNLFRCAITGGDAIHIDPFGNFIPCICIREPKMNLLKEDLKAARGCILDWVRSRTFITNSKCNGCRIRSACFCCPGKALLEKGNLEAEIEWFCELANGLS